MSASGVNVLRWGALVAGLFYGVSHQSAIRSSDKRAEAQHAWDERTKLIQKAKAAYAEKTAPKSGNDGVISDTNDPNFDLGKYLDAYAK